jgi:hypothetical protein
MTSNILKDKEIQKSRTKSWASLCLTYSIISIIVFYILAFNIFVTKCSPVVNATNY